jgi:hypothetical protein
MIPDFFGNLYFGIIFSRHPVLLRILFPFCYMPPTLQFVRQDHFICDGHTFNITYPSSLKIASISEEMLGVVEGWVGG